ncbi:hypothetical protein DACRYDRAFT_22928 [Dacryopinax primogenitus]|uniref:Protein MON2 homolog n=1 Tax=Dacryopinax primogenitus (strain DJM 731) TaxID=1858805 RepID=M5GB32_DACPD|nr:uncharacterized protein DACRYDRAFT_22928 [Dacryopinax primogenitus]EJU01163.1 hypothetical protein DACRYDRAFT_22928 [Dacryopinax primogenitus]
MSALGMLSTDLQSISTESRRKHPEVRDAAEQSLAVLRSSPDEAAASLLKGDKKSDTLLQPVFLSCQTRNSKLASIALGTLQRLVASRLISPSFAPRIISTLSTDCLTGGVDIQLKVLQTLLSLLTAFSDVSGELLAEALLACFKLHESKAAVVSSTAAATLRQLVILVFDKVADEDQNGSAEAAFKSVQLPDGTNIPLRPFARDAYLIFSDLLLLVNSQKAYFLHLTSLSKTFTLELIESVLTNHHQLFRTHSELTALLERQLCPFLLKALSDRPHFPLMLRSVRVVFLFLRQFTRDLSAEAEVFLSVLTKSISGDNINGEKERPTWVRVLSAEVLRGLCAHPDLLASLFELYDLRTSEGRSPVFSNLITALARLASSKPSLLGTNAALSGAHLSTPGLGLPTVHENPSSYDVAGVAGMVASAAVAGVSGVVGGMMGGEGGLSAQSSAMKVPCIDQLDKTDAPVIPDGYVYLLALQTLCTVAEGLHTQTLPIYNTIMERKGQHSALFQGMAPRALDMKELPSDNSETQRLRLSYAMTESGWPALLASLSFFMSTNLSDELFVDVLGAFRALIYVSGVLGLATPRDAFFTSLSKFAVPPRTVSAYDAWTDGPHPTPKTPMLSMDSLAASSSAPSLVPPTLGDRNVACLKVYVSCAHYLAAVLGKSWYDVFETLQNAEHVLGFRIQSKGGQMTGQDPFSPKPPQPPAGGKHTEQKPRHPMLNDLDKDAVSQVIRKLFEASKLLDIAGFTAFVSSLCKLSADMVDMQTRAFEGTMVEDAMTGSQEELASAPATASPTPLSPRSEKVMRRASGMAMPKIVRNGDFGINKLGVVVALNLQRLVLPEAHATLAAVIRHLLMVLSGSMTPSILRLQATDTLDESLLLLSRIFGPETDSTGQVQRQVLDALAAQMSVHSLHGSSSTLEIRKAGLDTLHMILQQAGHTLVLGWETIFQILSSVIRLDLYSFEESTNVVQLGSPKRRPAPIITASVKNDASLIRVAFSSLKLICSDYLPSLSVEQLRLCITTLVTFGQQKEDLNIALTAGGGLLSNLSDYIQTKRIGESAEYDTLWMFLLNQLLVLCDDNRAEARNGSIQTLSRTLQLYGTTMTEAMWDECLWKVLLTLLENLPAKSTDSALSGVSPGPSPPTAVTVTTAQPIDNSWNDTRILAWHSLSAVISEFLAKPICALPSFNLAWTKLLSLIQHAVLSQPNSVGAAAMRALERIMKASNALTDLDSTDHSSFWENSWTTWSKIGLSAVAVDSMRKGYTQDILLALMETGSVVYGLSGKQWDIERCRVLLRISRGVMEYRHSPEYRLDVDSLSPCQAAVLRVIEVLDESVGDTVSLVLKELAYYTRLAFLPFTDGLKSPVTAIPPNSAISNTTAAKKATYIAVAKATMPLLVDRFSSNWTNVQLYNDGAVEDIIAADALPMALKYLCPAASRIGADPPLWKTATSSFISILGKISSGLEQLKDGVRDDALVRIWTEVVQCLEGALTADCSAGLVMPLVEQDSEEQFDRSLLLAMEQHVLPYLGKQKLPIDLVQRLPQLLESSSVLHRPEDELNFVPVPDTHASPLTQDNQPHTPQSVAARSRSEHAIYGDPVSVTALSRERFRYWCFDLLFATCSNSNSDHEPERRRLAALSLPILIGRCKGILASHVADTQLLGNIPFARIREEELLYALRKMLELRLWVGSFWAALSDDPSSNSLAQPNTDPSLPASSIIRDLMLRSSRAHIYVLYGLLCRIAASSHAGPIAWVAPDSALSNTPSKDSPMDPILADARQLACACLLELGTEMAV